MNRNEAIQHIRATLKAFGPDESITLTHDTWANLHAAMTALVEQPEQEPVAWLDEEINCAYTPEELDGGSADGLLPLYTAPTPRKPLTDEEIVRICVECWRVSPRDIFFARAIERAHGIGGEE